MDALEAYLTGPYQDDKNDLADLTTIIQEAAQTLVEVFDENQGWPYELRRESTPNYGDSISISTTAMVALSLWKICDLWEPPTPFGAAPKFPPMKLDCEKSVKYTAQKARQLLGREITKNKDCKTQSSTYGVDDPFTWWFLSGLCCVRGKERDKNWEKIRKKIVKKCNFYVELDGQSVARKHSDFFEDSNNVAVKKWVLLNAFTPLRAVQSVQSNGENVDENLVSYQEYFETTLHDQLSFSAIPDSRFDPAELAFCLEGLLLIRRSSVDPTLFQRFVDVLKKAQEDSAFWRPNKPFLAMSTGYSLFPVSVEVANSLLRSCEIYDGRTLADCFGSDCIPLFRRYWQWLRARKVIFNDANGKKCVGWHSEHINDTDVIHVWETSQVVEFLLAYRRLIQAHIARTTLVRSRFSLQDPKGAKSWSEIKTRFEPVTCLGPNYCTYEMIGNDFVEGWKEGKPNYYSMLLYGPPGTGKTMVAENIADALGFPMITITVSDFLAGGDAQLEARAKAIFDVLTSQTQCVVLFDEIDNFLLDREGKRYRDQESVFQFMTPGLLTKLNELRRSERVLFIIATNYENRIDPAIKRTGRIDKKYLLMPPDEKSRRRILKNLLRDHDDEALKDVTINDWGSLGKASLFLGFKDIEGAVKDTALSPTKDEATILKKLQERVPTSNLDGYSNKFKDAEQNDRSFPLEEFITLVGMALEVKTKDELINSEGQKSALSAASNKLGIPDNGKMAVRRCAPGLPAHEANRIASVLQQASAN